MGKIFGELAQLSKEKSEFTFLVMHNPQGAYKRPQV
jgi:hypothetical protein